MDVDARPGLYTMNASVAERVRISTQWRRCQVGPYAEDDP